MTAPARILIVEDSPSFRHLLTRSLERDPRFKVVEAVDDGHAALDAVLELQPDLVTLDVVLRGELGGEALTRQIMERRPTPIVVLSRLKSDDPKPQPLQSAPEPDPKPEPAPKPKPAPKTSTPAPPPKRASQTPRREPRLPRRPAVIAVGASAGGPPELARLLRSLPKDAPPVLIVQHIVDAFAEHFAAWLSDASGRPVALGRTGVHPEPGSVWVAPPDAHMVVRRGGRLRLVEDGPVEGARPSVSVLFRSVGEVHGSDGLCVVLTGMGRDGSSGARAAAAAGATLLVQSPSSALLSSMPQSTIDTGAPCFVRAPAALSELLEQILARGSSSRASKETS